MKKLTKILFKTYNNIFVLSGLLIILFSGALYLLLGKGAADALVEQMLHREQMVARAGAISLDFFTENLAGEISAFSARSSIQSFSEQRVQKELDILMDEWRNTSISGAIIADREGVVRFGVDREGHTGKGISIAERQYFIWAKGAKEGDFLIGEAIQSKIGFALGRYIVPVASPIIRDGQFDGVLVMSFLLDEVTVEYLNPLKITDNTRIYLIDNDGIILSGPVQNLVGINYLEYMDKSRVSTGEESSKLLRRALSSESEGKLDIALPDENKDGALTRYLIAYSPISIGNEHWVLAVATPATDALEFLAPFYFRELGLSLLAFLGFLIIVIRISKIKGHEEGVREEHEFHSGSTPQE